MEEHISDGLHFRSSKVRKETTLQHQYDTTNTESKDHDITRACLASSKVKKSCSTRRGRYIRIGAIVFGVVIFHLIVCFITVSYSKRKSALLPHRFEEKRRYHDNDKDRVYVPLFQDWSSITFRVVSERTGSRSSKSLKNKSNELLLLSPPNIANDLVERRIYDPENDFWNTRAFVPFWWNVTTTATKITESSIVEVLPTSNHKEDTLRRIHHLPRWGPCFPPYNETEVLIYTKLSVESNESIQGDDGKQHLASHPPWPDECRVHHNDKNQRRSLFPFLSSLKRQKDDSFENSLDEKCLPGFLIIGAGKSGTSSLYHYLTEHPRVAPARQKQVGYFKYFADKGLGCYLSFFPSFREFISSGALITGEAFPGYLPYPEVASRIQQTFTHVNDDQNAHPRMIVTVREPLSRAYSSYKYNYLAPALAKLRLGKFPNAPHPLVNQTDEYYIQNHIVSFEELLRAEWNLLKDCLVPGGRAEQRSLQKRQEMTLLPNKSESTRLFVDVEVCYESENDDMDSPIKSDKRKKKGSLPSRHIQELTKRYPKKLIYIPRNNHLIQSLLGRGLYALALDWWYGLCPNDSIMVICMEDISRSTEALKNVTSFLGLPHYNNFTSVINKGHYNVGSLSTSKRRQSGTPFLEEYDVPQVVGATLPGPNDEVSSMNHQDQMKKKGSIDNSIPLSPDLLQDINVFFLNHNERLFQMIGRRCSW